MPDQPETPPEPATAPAVDPVALERGGATPAQFDELISAGSQLAPLVAGGDSQARKEEKFFEAEHQQAKLQSYKQDTDQRKQFANRIFWMIVAWLAGVFCILLLQGFLGDHPQIVLAIDAKSLLLVPQFKLSDAVILALIGGTTVNVLGILIVVVQYLFPKRNST